jgi:steroid 5-alpha reductase family enzyme
MPPGELLAATATWVAASMFVLWLLSLRLRDASIVDVWWGPGFVAITAVAAWAAGAAQPRALLVLALVALWGLRLGAHLHLRNRGKGEDPRYVAMRRRWGARFPLVSLATVFALQGALMWFVSLPFQMVQLAPGPGLGALDALGVLVFAVGLGFEAVGDAQLARFKADPANAGRVMDRGLWRYTRHPNYFGDCLAHWGLYAIALSSPYAVWTLASPALMTFLLLRVSGVALLERSIGQRRPEYAAYQRRTNAFFPGPPRREDQTTS